MSRFPVAFLAHFRGKHIRLVIAAFVVASLASCASKVESIAGETKASTMADAPILGRWSSELDGAQLVIEPTGIFSVDVPARGDKPARSAVGRWTIEETSEDNKAVVFANLAGSKSCAEIPGTYRFELVRDTLRFELVRDECMGRQEHMAWPWTRKGG
ncbi:MAG: hypothetical protein ACKO3W_05685 [bacterium]